MYLTNQPILTDYCKIGLNLFYQRKEKHMNTNFKSLSHIKRRAVVQINFKIFPFNKKNCTGIHFNDDEVSMLGKALES